MDGKPYNVVLIMTDQQPLKSLGCYGNPHNPTPHLDELAARGVRFDNCYVAGFPCGPSRGSLFSGRYPHSHGAVDNDVLLRPEVPSLGNILSAHGYDMAYVGKWHLGGQSYRDLEGAEPHQGAWYSERTASDEGFRFVKVKGGGGEDEAQHGFDARWIGGWQHYRQYLREVGLGEAVDAYPPMGVHHIWPSGGDEEHCYSQIPEEHHVEAFLAQKAVQFIRQRTPGDPPFGLVLSFYGPHLPVAPPRPWDDIFALDDIALPENHWDQMENKPYQVRCHVSYKLDEWSKRQFKDYARRYWGFCAYIDEQAGRVLNALSEAGLEENTIVIFTTDHGDMVGAHGMVWKSSHCGYEELVHVPLIMRVPGLTRPDTTIAALTSNIDILPTVLALVGAQQPPGIQGRSLLPLLSGEQADFRRQVFCDGMDKSIMTCDGRWKYALNWRPRDIDELYDLKSDPGEMKNLVDEADYQDRVSQMQQRIFNWLRDTNHPYAHVIQQAAGQPVSVKDYPQAKADTTGGALSKK